MKASREICKSLLVVHDGLIPVWNSMLERFQIMYHDRRSGITRLIMTVEEEDGEFRSLDTRTVNWLRDNVAWDSLDKYPNPKDLYEHMTKLKNKNLEVKRTYRKEFRKWWNKEHREEWKQAYENFKRGILYIPPKKDKKIYI